MAYNDKDDQPNPNFSMEIDNTNNVVVPNNIEA